MASSSVGLEVEVGFFPLMFALFFARPRVEIDGAVHSRPWGTHFFPVAPGDHLVSVYFRYLFIERCGQTELRVTVPDGHCVRIRYFMWKPWVLASGSLKPEGSTPVGPAASRRMGEATKPCPRCAEDLRVEAHVCRHCKFEFSDADVASAVRESQELEAANRHLRELSRASERLAAEQRAEYARYQGAIIMMILIIQIGLVVPASLLGISLADSPGVEPSGLLLGGMFASYAAAAALAVRQWRRARRIRDGVVERAAREGNYFACRCGEPIKPYYWIHYLLCAVVIGYGYLSLFVKLKRCRKCRRDYAVSVSAEVPA